MSRIEKPSSEPIENTQLEHPKNHTLKNSPEIPSLLREITRKELEDLKRDIERLNRDKMFGETFRSLNVYGGLHFPPIDTLSFDERKNMKTLFDQYTSTKEALPKNPSKTDYQNLQNIVNEIIVLKRQIGYRYFEAESLKKLPPQKQDQFQDIEQAFKENANNMQAAQKASKEGKKDTPEEVEKKKEQTYIQNLLTTQHTYLQNDKDALLSDAEKRQDRAEAFRLFPKEHIQIEAQEKAIVQKKALLEQQEKELEGLYTKRQAFGEKNEGALEAIQKEIEQKQDEIRRLEATLGDTQNQIDISIQNLLVKKYQKIPPEKAQEMQKIMPLDFLGKTREERLTLITRDNVASQSLTKEGIRRLRFNFTFDGNFNRELYLAITAGQVLPKEVESVESRGEIYTRQGLLGEFYSPQGKRLVIRQETEIYITKFRNEDDLKVFDDTYRPIQQQFEKNPYKKEIEAAARAGIDPVFFAQVFAQDFHQKTQDNPALLENMITEINRAQGRYIRQYPHKNAYTSVNGKIRITEGFAGFLINTTDPPFSKERLDTIYPLLKKEYQFTQERLKSTPYQTLGNFFSVKKPEEITLEHVSQSEKDAVLAEKRIIKPGSRAYSILFSLAAKSLGLPESWVQGEALIKILQKESGGMIGRLNYTLRNYPNISDVQTFRAQALRQPHNTSLGVTKPHSTATGLGQMILKNVDQFYPDGRAGIGDAFNEAVGCLAYIKARYGSPEAAWRAHQSKGWY